MAERVKNELPPGANIEREKKFELPIPAERDIKEAVANKMATLVRKWGIEQLTEQDLEKMKEYEKRLKADFKTVIDASEKTSWRTGFAESGNKSLTTDNYLALKNGRYVLDYFADRGFLEKRFEKHGEWVPNEGEALTEWTKVEDIPKKYVNWYELGRGGHTVEIYDGKTSITKRRWEVTPDGQKLEYEVYNGEK